MSTQKRSSTPDSKQLAAIKALINVQRDIDNPLRTGVAEDNGRTWSYPKADEIMAAARPLLASNELLMTKEPMTRESGSQTEVGYEITFSHVEGGVIVFSPMWFPGGRTAHERGAGWSYAARYAVMNALNLAGEDDDAVNLDKAQRAQTAPDTKLAKDTPTKNQADAIKREAKKLGVDPADIARENGFTGYENSFRLSSALISELKRRVKAAEAADRRG